MGVHYPWHEAPWQRLMAARERGTMPHALLLAGPTALGKRAFAERLAWALLCERPTPAGACGTCRACLLLQAGTHPDLTRVQRGEASSGKLRQEIVINQIRELSARLALASQFGGWKVALIDPADAMNRAAANALLKTLEEPAGAGILILVADAPWRLPITVRSRCQAVHFRPPARDQALAWLHEAGVDDAPRALDAAGGNPGLARRWAEDGSLAEYDAVRTDLGALAQGRDDAYAIMRRWTGDDALALRLRFAVRWCRQQAVALARGEAPVLATQRDLEGLTAWAGAANAVRETLRGPLRADLQVIELLRTWH